MDTSIRHTTRLCALSVFVVVALAGAGAQTTNATKQAFLARCAGCHGDDGTGGGHGPDIVNVAQPRGVSKDAVRNLILNGIPEAGMPAFEIPTEQADDLAAYVMLLKGTPAGSGGPTAAKQNVPGDPLAGETFFAGKGTCTSCHMVRGLGGVLGPDLSNVGDERTLAQIEQALADPGGGQQTGGGRRGGGGDAYQAATVHLRSGETIRGIVKNQSAFDLQLLGVDGKLYLLLRDQVESVVSEKSLMPKVEATPPELRDLLAYLSRLSMSPNATFTDPTAKFNMSNAGGTGGLPFAGVAQPKLGSWPTYHGNESGNRFSPLNQINTSSVGQLAPNWIFTLGAPSPGDAPKLGVPSWSGLEGTPIVVDGVMYVTSVNEAYALDARSGRQIWHYSRPRSHGLAGDAGGGINRGVAVLGDRVFMVTDNAHLIALHRLTGQLMWDVTMADSGKNYGSTSAPLVVNDLVIAGVSGGDEGIRGFLDAYKASTGEHVWRFWTVPAAGEPGSETWRADPDIEHGCASTWLTGTYDPEANILYWPTGNPCPDYNGAHRQGDDLYSSSMLALDPETGKLHWYYQFSPHDLYDWDATETPMLVDAVFQGSPRKLLVQANRNGFFYVLDRLTGKVLLAEPFVKKVTWASAIGPDGRPMRLPPNDSCSMGSAANWPSTAFNPGTGLFYVMAAESCTAFTPAEQQWEAGQSFYGGGTHRIPGAVSGGQFMRALDLQTGKIAWQLPQMEGSTGSGILATAGGLLFYGDSNGAFSAVDAKDGKPLWHFNTSQRFRSSPMTYSLDGNQYIAVTVGPTVLAFRLP